MLCLTSVAIATAIAIYAASGAAALSYFGDALQGDVLLNLAAIDSHLVRAVRPYISSTSPLHLPYISPISPLHLPHISPTSPLYLPHISRASPQVRLGFGVSICLTYPCLHYAARRSIDQLLFGSAAEGASRGTPDA